MNQEKWDEFHQIYQGTESMHGLTSNDDAIWKMQREKDIQLFGNRIREKEYLYPRGEEICDLEQVIVKERELTDNARGKVLRLQADLREAKDQIRSYELQNKVVERQENAARERKHREQSAYETLLDRAPPANTVLEMTLLAMFLKQPELLAQSSFSQPYVNKMFYADDHRIIHSTMMTLGQKLNYEVLESRLQDDGKYEAIGGGIVLRELEARSITANVDRSDAMINILEQLFLRREFIQFCTSGFREAYENDKCDEKGKNIPVRNWVEHIRQKSAKMLDLLPFRFRKSYSRSALVDDTMQDFLQLEERKGRPKISTKYEKLDRVLHGIQPRKLIVVGATTKTGKSTFALNLADNVAMQEFDSLMFTYEEPPSEMVQKLIGKRTNIDTSFFEYWSTESLPENYGTLIRQTTQEIKEKLPIHFDSQRPPNLEHIIARCTSLKAIHPRLSFVVIDGLNSFSADRFSSRTDTYYNILSRLKDLAIDLELCVLVNAQLKREAEGRRPSTIDQLADCKGAGDVADNILFLYRPEKNVQNADKEDLQGWIEVIPIALKKGEEKEKNFKLKFNRKTSLITS